MYSSTNFIKSATVWVPQSVYDTYQSKTLDNSSAWYGVEVHYEGWEPKKITINEKGIVSKGGLFQASAINKEGFDKSQFVQADKRELNVIPLNSRVVSSCNSLPMYSLPFLNIREYHSLRY